VTSPAVSPLVYSSTASASAVHGVHGAAGRTRWACFATRRDLRSACEAVEWASVPPGGISGEHLHTRTEESYFVVQGEGEILLNGVPRPVKPRSLVLTGVGVTHGLRNTGNTDLDWLVIESLAPATSAVLAGTSPGQGEVPVSNAVVIDMNQQPVVDTTEVFSGPLRQVRLTGVAAGDTVDLDAGRCERTMFVLSGSGVAVSGRTTVGLETGVCVTLPLGSGVRITAGDRLLELFVATLAVPAGESS
jgi:mannose-6-phosphate isomerase-like protein (cupin superfamily)